MAQQRKLQVKRFWDSPEEQPEEKTVKAETEQQVRRGRPKKAKPEINVNVVPVEEHYLCNTSDYLPWSTSLRADHYLALKRMEFHSGRSIREMVEEAMTKYLKKQPDAEKPLPEAEAAKLKVLLTARDRYWLRKEED